MALPEYVPKTKIDELTQMIETTYSQLETEINSLPSQGRRLCDNIAGLAKSYNTTGGTTQRNKINNTIYDIEDLIRQITGCIKSMGGSPKIDVVSEGECFYKTVHIENEKNLF